MLIKLKCDQCGVEFTRKASRIRGKKNLCSLDCNRKDSSSRMAVFGKVEKPIAVRLKLRESHLKLPRNKENKQRYIRVLGEAEHRLVMEQMIGRKLLPGEIVHHIDENKWNNDPSNLMLFSSAAAHNRYHKLTREENERTEFV